MHENQDSSTTHSQPGEENRSDTARGSSPGMLYVVATPIGNLADMVPRAVQILQQVDLIAAEDTRHSGRLLEHFHVSTPTVAYHNFNERQSIESLLSKLLAGQQIALISDAGTPLISDPGYRLVRAARDAGISVVPIPGPCALISALSVSALPSDRFVFEGFLPAKPTQRQKRLRELDAETRTLIVYEAPHRLVQCLEDLVEVFGNDRRVFLGREMTKTFETYFSGTTNELLKFVATDVNQQRGEVVLVIAGNSAQTEVDIDPEAARVMEILAEEMPPKQAATLASKITGVNKKTLYQWSANKS